MTDEPAEVFRIRNAPSTKCTAHSKRTGAPCNNPPIAGLSVCRMHGGATKAAKAAARRRLDGAADRMAKQLLKMAIDENVSDAVKLTAIRDALDRRGLKAPTTVEVEVGTKPWEAWPRRSLDSRRPHGPNRVHGADLSGPESAALANRSRRIQSRRRGRCGSGRRPRGRRKTACAPGDVRSEDERGSGPGNATMTLEAANRITAEINTRTGVYDRRSWMTNNTVEQR